MPLTPTQLQRLAQCAAEAANAGHGAKAGVYAQACADLQISLPTLHRYLAQAVVRPQRKQRSDAGDTWLTMDEALAISAVLQESHRKTGKRLMSMTQAINAARSNGLVRAERIDAGTGEVLPLSDSAIANALRHYKLHPDMLNVPKPAVELRSLHPNHVWQIDASLCVLYYLQAKTLKEDGLQVMRHSEFYKNKPANLKRIAADRVWSYEATDHYSGAIFVHYVMGAESSANLIESFLTFISQRAGTPMHGVPQILMMDMGSANTSGSFKNLARRLGVQLIAHSPGNARATGQVEKARDLIERGFESGLKFRPVADLAELNLQATRWAAMYNSTQVHSRHGKTRLAMWLTIRAEQLRIAPPMEHLRALVNDEPQERRVSDKLRVSLGGKEYDVSRVPGIMVRQPVRVALNPYLPECAVLVEVGSDGHEVLHTLAQVEKDDAGFATTANIIGEEYNAAPRTVLEDGRDAVELRAMGVATLAEAEAKRKARALPFGGQLDPWKAADALAANPVAYVPKLGTALEPQVSAPAPEPIKVALPVSTAQGQGRQYSVFEVCAWLVNNGFAMTREANALVQQWHPQGCAEADLEALKAQLERPQPPVLRVVNGGAI
jgi:transposase InsO family protein